MSEAIQHVSDTALLVAAARAFETQLEYGVVHDPFAARLVGERGFAIGHSGSQSRWHAFGIGLRSRFIDEMLLAELRSGAVDCVLCLGAGLDARPWRLDFPSPDVRWIEVDFAPILDYKHAILVSDAPRCRLERMTADVTVESDRTRVFEAAADGGNHCVLLLTEGLLFYLSAGAVRAIASEAHVCSRWLIDVAPPSPLLLANGGDAMRQLHELRHETHLEGAEMLDVIQQSGWTAEASRTFLREGMPFAIERMKHGWTFDPNRQQPSPDDPAGVWLFRNPTTPR